MSGPASHDRAGAGPRCPSGPLFVGVGAARGVRADEIGALIDSALAGAGLVASSVRCVVTVDRRAGEEGILRAARERGWDVVAFPAEALAAIEVPNPSEAVRARAGTPSVAEAAAVHAARSYGGTAELLVGKLRSAAATVAVARPVPADRSSAGR